MPLSAAQLTALQTSVDAVVSEVAALQADADPHPLQVLLDAANATIASMQAKIATAKASLVASAAADAAEDAGRQGAIAALE